MPVPYLFRMRRLSVVLLIALACLLGLAASAAGERGLISLSAGESAFWTGPNIDTASGDSWEYRIRVEESAYRLRIGFDHPDVEDNFQVQVFNPDGSPAERLGPGAGLYSAEFQRYDPEVGTWRVEVVAQEVADSSFRMRAKLESREPPIGKGKEPVLPNLQVLPLTRRPS